MVSVLAVVVTMIVVLVVVAVLTAFGLGVALLTRCALACWLCLFDVYRSINSVHLGRRLP